MLNQRTLKEKAICTGIGLHSGQSIRLEILPAPENTGIVFTRTDIGAQAEVAATVQNVVDTRLATTLGSKARGVAFTVGTVEHLMSAFYGLGIDNARVLLDGPEVPVLDGSAEPFVEMLLGAGLEFQRTPRRFLVVKKEVTVREEGRKARIAPGSGFRITCTVDFDHPLISTMPYRFEYSERAFRRDIARARTFGFLHDVEALRKIGLARGGSLDNAIVIDQYRILNPEGLRYPDEFVRHKLLDALGDLSLFGMPIVGQVTVHRGGHCLNTELVRRVLADRRAYEIVEPAPAEIARANQGESTAFGVAEPIEGVV